MSWEDAADAIKAGFISALGLTLEPQDPSEDELYRTNTLLEEKYKNEEWTYRLPK